MGLCVSTQPPRLAVGLVSFSLQALARACAFHPGDRFPSFEAFRDAVVGTRRELERAGHGDDWLPCDAENLFFLESTLPVSRISGFPLIPEEDPFRTIQ